MKDIPIQNYVKVFVLFLVTIIVTLVLSSNYKQKIQYERSNKDVMSFLSVVKYDELENYLIENHDILVYMASSADTSVDEFEEKFKNYILEEELEKDIIYLDTSTMSKKKYNQFKNKLFSTELKEKVISFGDYPNIMAVHDGKITDLLYIENTPISIDDIKNFVNVHMVIQ